MTPDHNVPDAHAPPRDDGKHACECGCGHKYPRLEMMVKATDQESHPLEYINRKHAIKIYGSLLAIQQAGFF